jgi:LL-diaminopimelate aminotransferase
VNYPSNPTGQIADKKHLEQIVWFAKKHNLIILYDNAYSEITFDGYIAPSILEIEGAKDIAVEIGSFSKTFSFAGYRMGWIVGNKQLISSLAKVKSQMDSGMTLPIQRLAAYTLSHSDELWFTKMISSYQKRRDIIAKHLQTLGLTFTLPKASLYIWAKIPDNAKDAESFAHELLQKKNILVTPGTAFGKNGSRFVRVSICINIEAIDTYFAL